MKTSGSLGVNEYPSGNTVPISSELTRPADTADYAANDCISNSVTAATITELANCVAENGDGGWISEIVLLTTITQLAGLTVRVYYYNTAPAVVGNDNVQYAGAYSDKAKIVGFADVNFEVAEGNSNYIIGKYQPMIPFKCASGSTSLYCEYVTQDAISSPTNGGTIYQIAKILRQ